MAKMYQHVCKPEDTFLQYADRRDDNGNKWQYSSLTSTHSQQTKRAKS